MKKILLPLLALFFIVSSCSDGDENVVQVPQCSAVTSLSVVQNFGDINVTLSANPGALYYELSVVYASHNNGPESGQIQTLGSPNEVLPISLVEQQTSMIYYARTVCPDGTKGEWFGPKLVNLQPYCGKVSISSVSEYNVQWSSVYQANTYQVQYGPAGFALGTGITATITGNNNYSDHIMAAGQTYDFYVRANCVNNGGFGAWSQKYTFTSQYNVNTCDAPTNLRLIYTTSTRGQFEWNYNGSTSFEYTMVNPGQSPDTGQIYAIGTGSWPSYTIPAGAHGDFYVRAVCPNGSDRSAWVKKSI